jgi:hypothetical protein
LTLQSAVLILIYILRDRKCICAGREEASEESMEALGSDLS